MIFKVINDENKRVIAAGLTIDVARKIARSYNSKHKTDIFTISSQLDKPYRAEFISSAKRVAHNGEEISEVIKREIKEFLADMINHYPNDASLGAAIRIYQQNTN
jgi:hypothetical protein